jgi:hypothetical protein
MDYKENDGVPIIPVTELRRIIRLANFCANSSNLTTRVAGRCILSIISTYAPGLKALNEE